MLSNWQVVDENQNYTLVLILCISEFIEIKLYYLQWIIKGEKCIVTSMAKSPIS